MGDAASLLPPPEGDVRDGRRGRGIRERLRRQALDLVERERLDAGSGCRFRRVSLGAVSGGVLQAEDIALHAPALVPASGRLTALACGVATLGPALERRVAELFAERRVALALALDQLGNEMLLALSRRMQDRIAARAAKSGETLACALHPGDPGLPVEAQAAVLRLAGADSLGVTLGAGGLMRPHKSASVIAALGIGVPAADWSRCAACPSRGRCTLRATAEAA